ncbi:ArsR family transcriptional regulator [Aeromonas enteropelogenes]|uniref:VpaChn25_0724 family phage protein n=1 Tax=Aeromonas enteropelogenes TaxID=29489 RepID=UPI003BA0D983
MSMNFKELQQQDRRLVLLRSLVDMGGFEANESILEQCLGLYGHACGRDVVRTELAWLAEQDLVTVRDVSGCMVATLTGRGSDAARGVITVPGVKRPRP